MEEMNTPDENGNYRYFLVDNATHLLVNVFAWNGNEDVSTGGWQVPDGYSAVVVPDELAAVVSIGWTYLDGEWSAPPVPPKTPEQILNENQSAQASLINVASVAMAPVLVSLQLGDATDEETTLAKAWQTYYRAVLAVDLTVENPIWPVPPNEPS